VIAFAFPPPTIPGIGLDFFIEDRAGHDVDYPWNNTAKFLAAARKRPNSRMQMNLLFTSGAPPAFLPPCTTALDWPALIAHVLT
jgi:hypothetical protein